MLERAGADTGGVQAAAGVLRLHDRPQHYQVHFLRTYVYASFFKSKQKNVIRSTLCRSRDCRSNTFSKQNT